VPAQVSPLEGAARSYSTQLRGTASQLREAVGLYRVHSQGVDERVAVRLADMREVEQRIEGALGEPLVGKRVLDVGAGQVLLQMVYFGRRNEATGIDLEVIAQGADVRAYARMLQVNGARRTFKTLGRKLLQVDRHYRRELLRQCGLRRFPRMRVLQMDATAMSFADGEFDVVHSSSVLPHIPEPERAVREMARVLRPGGVAHLNFHLYTSDTGSEDPRVIRNKDDLPLWPHLRPSLAGMVHQHAFLNKLRLAEWQRLLSQAMPGCELSLRGTDDEEQLREQAISLQAQGELTDYTLQELLTRKLLVLWRKP
jgi:SAM-dependent methyltransferase